MRSAPPVQGSVAPGFEPVADQFRHQVETGEEIGAALCVYRGDARVVDLWGGWADREAEIPWTADTLVVVFSATKGLAAMALNLAAQQGRFDWDAPVARYWPAFGQAGKADISVRTLFEHRAGLASLTTPFSLAELCDPAQADSVRARLAAEAPGRPPDGAQAYHAMSFGMYADAFFAITCGEPLRDLLHRELLDPLGADVFLGTPPAQDTRVARLYPVSLPTRLWHMAGAALSGGSTESRVARSFLGGGLARSAMLNPPTPGGMGTYNLPPVRRAALPWASATASARGLARAYVPWANGGRCEGRRYLDAATLTPLRDRHGWADPDPVLGKALGWNQGFLKEEAGVFSPGTAGFGHAGMGGALGWCDPDTGLSLGYTLNRCDWRVRSPRTLALCAALARCAGG